MPHQTLPDQQTPVPLWTRDFLAICFSSFFVFMTFYMLAVTLPGYVLDELHGSKGQIGLVTTVFVIAAVVFRPLTGKWLDEGSRRKLLLTALVLYMICSALYLTVHSLTALLALRVLHGVSFGIAATATSAIAVDRVPAARKGEGVGYFSLFMSLAMVVGPYLGLMFTGSFSYTVLFAACAVLALLALVCGSTVRIPPHVPKPVTGHPWHWTRFIEPAAIPISLAGSVLAFSYGAISTFISVFAKEIGQGAIASYFFIVFAAMILISRPFTGRIFDRRGEHVLVYPGLVLFVVGMLLLSQAHTAAFFLFTGAVIGLGFGALLPSFQAIALKAAPAHRSGLATGTYFVLFDTGYGLGSYILGIVAAGTSYGTMYLVGAVITAFTVVLYYLLHHRKQNRAAAGRQAA
ncbi:Quinolone resistance protein, major facilitator family transporter [Paenibacillus mucilaginosus 3016]|uniref:Quinolone resistance protein, major facilitator family transporter n=2 Tax=Paenibacillus mucilaginosus TaxID=61624 RepID=H6NM63_9BACL|nr:MFS transporter [Paenibacillus mucilaginosus]AFC32481.1 Quinolone resistance protein, major facilitator family transporter [Paenibacillus mucilaginosus 3016]AFH64796.1 MFS transporter [Paenibacillus mucilaginosus K02]WFA20961.1 MFS transporter [Paenibacillus mucilaginosus]